eukprot:2989734-Heterocapsa_arctica.AAC.1
MGRCEDAHQDFAEPEAEMHDEVERRGAHPAFLKSRRICAASPGVTDGELWKGQQPAGSEELVED